MDHIPRFGKRELICLLLFTCNYVVSVKKGFLFLWVLGMGYVILLWHSLSLPYNYFDYHSIRNEQASMESSLSHYKSMGYLFRHSRTANPVIHKIHANDIILLEMTLGQAFGFLAGPGYFVFLCY